MGVERRENGIFIRYKDVDGSWRYRKTTATNIAEAESLLRDIERNIERQKLGLDPHTKNPNKWTLKDLMEWWLLTYSVNSPAHDRTEGSVRKQILSDELASLPLDQVTAGRIEQLLQRRVAAGYSPQTVNHVRGFMQRAFTQARRAGHWLADNPVNDVKNRKVPTRTYETLSAEEVRLVLAEAHAHHRGILAVAIFAALRKGEVVALRKKDVDLERRVMHIRHSHENTTTKGGHADAIPIHEELVPYLEEAIEAAKGQYVFPNPDGSMRDGAGFQPENILRRTLTRAGIIKSYTLKCRRKGCKYLKDVEQLEQGDCPKCGFKLWITAHPRPLRFHDLRHTAATLMLEAGADLHAVQRILRHRSPVTTMKTYGHVQQDYLRDQLSKMKVKQVGDRPEFATPVLPCDASTKENPESSSVETLEDSGFVAGGADGTRRRPLSRERRRHSCLLASKILAFRWLTTTTLSPSRAPTRPSRARVQVVSVKPSMPRSTRSTAATPPARERRS